MAIDMQCCTCNASGTGKAEEKETKQKKNVPLGRWHWPNKSRWIAIVILWLCSVLHSTECEKNVPLEYPILEEMFRGTLVGNIAQDARLKQKYDSKTFKTLRYRFLTQPELDRTYFAIEENTGIISTTARIDRDLICPHMLHCFLKFDVAISPVQYFQIVKVNVEVIDVNDNQPTFPQREMTFDISESTLPGTSFAVPAAVDTDSSFKNGIQDYKLVSNSDKFDLRITRTADGTTDLRLVLKEPLDREKLDYYQLRIIAYDGGSPSNSGSVMIDVEVQDANDNDPVFENATYEVFVMENIPIGSVIARVKARDPDEGINGEILYKFSRHTQQEFGHLFSINGETGEVFVKDNMDYETGDIYLLSLVAHDRGADSLPATASLVVRVRDMNDNPPQINVNTLTTSGEAEVAENAKIGTFVAHISVEDADSGENGKFACAINNNNFQLQKLYHTEFKIVTSKVFDRETRDSYTVPLVCKDKGNHPQTSVVNIPVKVIDENDHTPIFWPPRYSAILEENNPIGAYILKVNATDGEVGPNGKVSFKLDENAGDLVTVEPNSGLITAAIIFNYERLKNFEFVVYAVDEGEPSRSATASIHMTILDTDDEQPKFSQDTYSFGTFENMKVGTEVGRVIATDADNPPFNSFFFRMDPYHSAVDTFEIDSETGIIYTKKRLDREGQPVYYLNIIADPGNDIMFSSTASVTIYVADKNDNEPVFDFPTVENNTIRISNKAPVGHVFSRLQAHDLDSGNNAKLTFGIVEGNRGNTFSVDPVTGVVSINTDMSNLMLEQFYLKVVVKDNGEPQLKDYEDLLIVVSHDIAFPVKADPFALEGDNLVIVLAFGLATLFVVIVIVIAIIIIIRRRNREHGNGVVCDKEMQKMLQPVQMMDDNHKGPPPSNAYVTSKDMEQVKNQLNKQDTGHVKHASPATTDVSLNQLNDDHRIIIREISPVSEQIYYWNISLTRMPCQ